MNDKDQTESFYKKYLVLYGVGILILCGMFFFLKLPFDEYYIMDEMYVELEKYIEVEHYVESEQYLDMEVYTDEQEISIPLSYRVVGESHYGGSANITIENIDLRAGAFVVRCDFKTHEKGTFHDEQRVYLLPGEQKFTSCKADFPLYEGVVVSYTIEPGIKTESVKVEKTRPVEKVRLVQKTRPVEKIREIEKLRPVVRVRTVPLYLKLMESFKHRFTSSDETMVL